MLAFIYVVRKPKTLISHLLCAEKSCYTLFNLTPAAVKKILDEEGGPNLESFASTLAIMNIKRALHYTGRLYDEFVFLRAVFLFPFNI